MRIVYSILGVLFISAGAVIYGLGPRIDFTDKYTVSDFVGFATPTLTFVGMALIVMAIFSPRREARPEKSKA